MSCGDVRNTCGCGGKCSDFWSWGGPLVCATVSGTLTGILVKRSFKAFAVADAAKGQESFCTFVNETCPDLDKYQKLFNETHPKLEELNGLWNIASPNERCLNDGGHLKVCEGSYPAAQQIMRRLKQFEGECNTARAGCKTNPVDMRRVNLMAGYFGTLAVLVGLLAGMAIAAYLDKVNRVRNERLDEVDAF